jgi:hypothetical protein
MAAELGLDARSPRPPPDHAQRVGARHTAIRERASLAGSRAEAGEYLISVAGSTRPASRSAGDMRQAVSADLLFRLRAKPSAPKAEKAAARRARLPGSGTATC